MAGYWYRWTLYYYHCRRNDANPHTRNSKRRTPLDADHANHTKTFCVCNNSRSCVTFVWIYLTSFDFNELFRKHSRTVMVVVFVWEPYLFYLFYLLRLVGKILLQFTFANYEFGILRHITIEKYALAILSGVLSKVVTLVCAFVFSMESSFIWCKAANRKFRRIMTVVNNWKIFHLARQLFRSFPLYNGILFWLE